MDLKPNIKLFTLGHSQHGKSSVAGFIYSYLWDCLRLNDKKNNPLYLAEKIRKKNNFHYKLRYALIFDGPRDDIYIDKDKILKTITTRPYTLQIESNSEQVTLTDLPGHQSFIHRVCGAIERSDIGLLVIDASAMADITTDTQKYLEEILTCFDFRKDRITGVSKGTSPKAYINMIQLSKKLGKKKRLKANISAFDTKYHSIKERIKPPTLAGIFNYLLLAWHLGIRKFIVAVHKMDIIKYEEDTYRKIEQLILNLLEKISDQLIKENDFFIIPTAIECDEQIKDDINHNITHKSSMMQWYKGKLLSEAISEMKDSIGRKISRNIESLPFRFQIESYKVTNPSKSQTAHFQPYISGFLCSGKIKEGDEITIPYKNKKDEFCGNLRITSIQKDIQKLDSQIYVEPDRFYKIIFSQSKLKELHPNEYKKIFYLGNFALKNSEIKNKPIIMSNEIKISGVFVGGWLFREKFNANLIYGFIRTDAKFIIDDFQMDNDRYFWATVKLKEYLPFCNQSEKDTFKKVVIELNTFIVGIGSIETVL